MRYALFWDVIKRTLVVIDVSGQPYTPTSNSQDCPMPRWDQLLSIIATYYPRRAKITILMLTSEAPVSIRTLACEDFATSVILGKISYNTCPGVKDFTSFCVSRTDFRNSLFRAPLLGVFAKLRKATISFVMSVSLSFRMEQLDYH